MRIGLEVYTSFLFYAGFLLYVDQFVDAGSCNDDDAGTVSFRRVLGAPYLYILPGLFFNGAPAWE